MAKKKPKPKASKLQSILDIDPEQREFLLEHLFGGAFSEKPKKETPLSKAQEMVDQAFNAPNEKQARELALEALEICPDCSEAYCLLAELSISPKESLKNYELAVAAGERSLGQEAFEQHVGHFWSLHESRPYMKARLCLAHELWFIGRQDESIQHMWELLRLNPNDSQGVRYSLASHLLLLDRDDELDRLFGLYDEDSTDWAFNKTLFHFRKEGDTPKTRRLLTAAKKNNKHVLMYLNGEEDPPQLEMGAYSPGDKTEAVNYINGCLGAWKMTFGALAWLRSTLVKPRKKKDISVLGPTAAVKKQLTQKITQKIMTWQAIFFVVPIWVKDRGRSSRPWCIVVMCPEEQVVLNHAVLTEEPTTDQLWDSLVKAIQTPMTKNPYRPTTLEVKAHERWQTLKPHLDEIGIDLIQQETLKEAEAIVAGMTESVGGKPIVRLIDMPGVTPGILGKYYEAAAHFFEHALWKRLVDRMVIKVECDRFQSGPWYAIVMGQSGLMLGLTLYENLDVLKNMYTSQESFEQLGRKSVAITVEFGEQWVAQPANVDVMQEHGWPVARSDAYTDVFRKELGLSMRPPLAWELELLTGCFHAIPEFTHQRKWGDSEKEEIEVPLESGSMKLILSWVDVDETE